MIAAFDFDHAIIEVNSDTYINKLLMCERDQLEQIKYSPKIEEIYKIHGWTARMQAVFDLMHQEFNIGELHFIECLKEIKISDSMKRLFCLLKEKNYELVIISDANTVFIETILKQNGLDSLFNIPTNIYTNYAKFDQTGRLQITPLNQIYNKDGRVFECSTSLCTANICKGLILKNLVTNLKAEQTFRMPNIYVGDGNNDYCPGLVLETNDMFFVKKNFSLAKRLQNPVYLENLKCNVCYWSDASDIFKNIMNFI